MRRLLVAVFAVLSVAFVGLQPASADSYPSCTITGTAASETLTGTEGNDVICTGGGNDTINALGGDDVVIATGPGDVIVNAGSGNDTIDATKATDATVDAGSGDDIVYGSPGDDTISGGDGNDTIDGNDGNDNINAGDGTDTVTGDNGNDTITGGDGNDNLNGDNGNDTITGGSGDDTINGGDGNDTLNGTAGDDTLIGGEGDDTMNGGQGGDSLFGNAGTDAIDGQEGNDTIDGGPGNDVLKGSEGDDSIIGGEGIDSIFGGFGSDILHGNAGDDRLYGDTGSDSLFGEAGDDVVAGGEGVDSLNGGVGLNSCDFTENELRTISCVYDEEAPVLEGLNFDQLVIDSTSRNSKLGIELHLKDSTGLAQVRMLCSLSSNGYTYRALDFTYILKSDSLMSNLSFQEVGEHSSFGDSSNFRLKLSVEIRKGQFPGSYNCNLDVQDYAGNKGNIKSVESFEVSREGSNFDDLAPQLVSVDFSKNPVDSGRDNETSTVTFEVSDENSANWGYFICEIWAGVSNNRAIELGWSSSTIYDYQSGRWGEVTRVNDLLTRYSILVDIKKGIAPGNYTCDLRSVDSLDNGKWFRNFTTFTVNRTGDNFDVSPPQIYVSADQKSVDIGSQSRTLEITLKQSDESGSRWSYFECGRRGGPVRFLDVGYQSGNVYDYTTTQSLQSWSSHGDESNFELTLNFTIPFGSNPGWYDCSATVLDKLGNRTDPSGILSFKVLRTPPGLPSEPLSLSFLSDLPTSGKLVWADPSFAGNPEFATYIIDYSSDGATWTFLQQVDFQVNELNISSLKPDTDYWFRIRGENGATLNQNLDFMRLNYAFLSIHTPPPTVSRPPQSLSATGLSGSGFSLQWSPPPYNGGSSLTDYSVESSRDGGQTWHSIKSQVSTATTLIVSGAAPGTTYLVRIAALNAVGQSDWLLGSVTTLTTTATSPNNLIFTNVTGSNCSLFWDLPSSNGGSAITDYLIEVSSNNGSSWNAIQHNPSNYLAFNVAGLLKNRSYMFRVSAINSVGTGSPSNVLTVRTLSTVPSAPTGLTVSSVTGTNVSLSWVAPADNGGVAITDYKVEVSRDSGSTWLLIPHSNYAAASLNVTGLVPAARYLVRVSATNGVGFSDYLTGEFTTQAVSSLAPTNLQASNVSDSSLTLSWGLPSSNGGSAITDYRVEVTSSGSDSWTVIPHAASNSLGFSVTNLLAGRTYQFRVAAVTSVGVGAYSNVLTVTTLGVVGPNAPASLIISNVKTNAASLSWSNVVATQKVSNYLVDVSTDGSTWVPVSKKVSTSTSLALSDLKLGTSYQVRVAAVNSSGVGNYVYGFFTTLAIASSAPTALVSSRVSSSGFNLNWTAPGSNGGSAISDYIVEINGGGYSWTAISHDVSANTSLTVTGLTPGTKYSVRVKAVNSVGISKNSSTLNVITLATTPGTPTALVLKSVTSTGAVISWTAPANGGAKITDYKVEYSLDQGQNWLTVSKSPSASTSLTLRNLRAATSYQVRVSASNVVGLGPASQTSSFRTS